MTLMLITEVNVINNRDVGLRGYDCFNQSNFTCLAAGLTVIIYENI